MRRGAQPGEAPADGGEGGGEGQRFDALGFLAEHGVVLASAHGPVPSVAEAVTGQPIRGSWWAHPRSHDIFRALNAIADSPDALSFKLIAGKVAFVHRRLWPALVRLAAELGPARLTAVAQEHTASGAHRSIATPFPAWVPDDVSRAARALGEAEAREQLGAWLDAELRSPAARQPPARRPPARSRPRSR